MTNKDNEIKDGKELTAWFDILTICATPARWANASTTVVWISISAMITNHFLITFI